MSDPQTIISALGAAASWAAVLAMLAQTRTNRTTPPSGAPVTPEIKRRRRARKAVTG